MSTLPTRPPQGPSFTSSLGSLWRDPATSQKLMALGLLVASLAVGAYGVRLLIQGSEQALYPNLEGQQAAETVEQLRGEGIEARLGDDGRSVWVSANQIEPARLALAANDAFPDSGSVGYELFDEPGIGMTDFQEQMSMRRALEGELQRTIAWLDEVSAARVHLVLPEKAAFLSEAEPAKASVQLRLARPITPRNAQTIAKLVAAAVPSLTTENVVLVDSQGRDLHSGNGENDGSLPTDQLNFKEAAEQKMVDQAVGILEKLVGSDRVRAQATVEMDMTRSEETVESVNPEQTVEIGKKREIRRSADASQPAIGIPGPRSNPAPADAGADPATPPDPQDPAAPTVDDPATTPAVDAAGASLVASSEPLVTYESETINSEVSRTRRHTSIPTGRVLRRSIAVVVDNAAGTDDAPGAPRTEDDIAKYREAVVVGLGLDLEAGDAVSVQNIPFVVTPEAEPFPEPSLLEQVQPYLVPAWRNLSWVLFLMIFYFVLFRPVLRKLSEPLAVPREVGMLPEVGGAAFESGGSSGALMEGRAEVGGPALLHEAQQVSQQSPEVASELVRGWLSEDAS